VKYWNPLANGVVGRRDAAGNKFYYLKDHLGSTRAVVNASGTVVEAHDYAAGIPSGLPVWAADEIRDGFHPGSCPDDNALAGMPGRDYHSGSETNEN